MTDEYVFEYVNILRRKKYILLILCYFVLGVTEETSKKN